MSSMNQLRGGSITASCSHTALRRTMPSITTPAPTATHFRVDGRRISHHASSGKTR